MSLPPRRTSTPDREPVNTRPTSFRDNDPVAHRAVSSGTGNASKFGYQPMTLADIDNKILESSTSYKSYFSPKYKEFKPKDGENYIRILPAIGFTFPKHVTRHYGIDLYLHFLMSSPKATIICPRRTPSDFKPKDIEDRCPVCEDVDRLYASNQTEQIAKLRIKAQKKTLAWVLDLKNREEKLPLLFAMPTTLNLAFIKLCKDRATGEVYCLDHPDVGFNVFFDRTKEFGGTKYMGESRDSRPTPVAVEYLDYVNSNPLPSVLVWRNYEEIQSLYGGSTPASVGDEEEARLSEKMEDVVDPSSFDGADDILSHYE